MREHNLHERGGSCTDTGLCGVPSPPSGKPGDRDYDDDDVAEEEEGEDDLLGPNFPSPCPICR